MGVGVGVRTHVCCCRGGHLTTLPPRQNRLVGLVVKASASGAEDVGFDFSGSSHTSDLKKKRHTNGYPARRLAI